jgi:hypothetical protein
MDRRSFIARFTGTLLLPEMLVRVAEPTKLFKESFHPYDRMQNLLNAAMSSNEVLMQYSAILKGKDGFFYGPKVNKIERQGLGRIILQFHALQITKTCTISLDTLYVFNEKNVQIATLAMSASVRTFCSGDSLYPRYIINLELGDVAL